MLDFDLLKDCYGCGACVNVCPRGAVHMTQAADGSYIPEIDEARCIGCGRCVELCPLNNVHLKNGKPVWGKNCTHCMACICYCPKEAIEYGKKSREKPRYHFEALERKQQDV